MITDKILARTISDLMSSSGSEELSQIRTEPLNADSLREEIKSQLDILKRMSDWYSAHRKAGAAIIQELEY